MLSGTLEQQLQHAALTRSGLNSATGLYRAIRSDGYYPAGGEAAVRVDGVDYVTQAATDWDTGDIRVYYARKSSPARIEWLQVGGEEELVFDVWPVPDAPYITQPFGARPEVYQQFGFPGHEGVDIRTHLNAPVYAVTDGEIGQITTSGNYGKCIRVIHHDGWSTLYAHLNAFAGKATGDVVKAGETIGFAGSTGNSLGVHLHFGLLSSEHTYVDDNNIIWPRGIHDPTPYLQPLLVTPPATLIDLLPYIKGDGTIYRMNVRWKGEDHQQQCQTQVDDSHFYLVKNHQWEEMWVEGEYICRGADTSPGDGMYYVQRQDMMTYGAKWCPRRWSVGGMYERNPLVTFYDSSTGKQLAQPESGYRRTWLKFEALHSKWQTHPNGLAFSDVVELTWYPRENGPAAESYFYARNFGLVAWRSGSGDFSYTAEVYKTGEVSPMSREEVAGL